MNTLKILPILCLVTLTFLGCERPEKTVDHLRKEIAEFRAAPDDQKSLAIEKSLAKLDSQILQLRSRGHTEKADLLQEQRDALAADFGSAKVYRTLQDAKSMLKGAQEDMQTSEESQGGTSPSPAESATPEEESVSPSPAESATPEEGSVSPSPAESATPEEESVSPSPAESVTPEAPAPSPDVSGTETATPEASPLQQ